MANCYALRSPTPQPSSSRTTHRQSSYRLARSRIPSGFLLAALCALPATLLAQDVIPQVKNPCLTPLEPRPLNRLSSPGRHTAGGDYLVIEYNAEDHSTSWYDYNHPVTGNPIPFNGSFLPIVYTREKIAVHVCNLHFTDQLTVTTSPLAIPEGGGDIRGFTSTTTLTPLSNTLDAIQNSTTAGSPVQLSGVGFGPTAALTVTGITAVTLGAIAPSATGTMYTPGTVTVSGKQIAQMMYAVRANAFDLVDTLKRTAASSAAPPLGSNGKPLPLQGCTDDPPPVQGGGINNSLPLQGGIDSLKRQIGITCEKVKSDTINIRHLFDTFTPPTEGPALAEASNAAAFDEDFTYVQSLTGQFTALANSLSSLGYGNRAVAVQNNYATLAGILDLARQGFDQHNCKRTPPALRWTPAQVAAFSPEDLRRISPEDIKAMTVGQIAQIKPSQLVDLSHDQLAAYAGPHDPDPPATPAGTVSGLTPDQIAMITPEQFGKLTVAELKALTPDQLAKVTAAR